jgi:c-di-GMP-binding flagellar brake protein YcgR
LVQPTPKKTLTSPIFAPVTEQWLGLAVLMQGKAQQALHEELWEDKQFKEDGYQISRRMISISTGKVRDDSAEVLKRFRWGMEFANKGQLQEVIDILDQYN